MTEEVVDHNILSPRSLNLYIPHTKVYYERFLCNKCEFSCGDGKFKHLAYHRKTIVKGCNENNSSE